MQIHGMPSNGGRGNVTEIAKERKQIPLSERAKLILEQREATVARGDARELARLTNKSRKSKQRDKTKHIVNTVNDNLDIRDKWLGIQQMKSDYKPNPYHLKKKKMECTCLNGK